MFSNEKNQDLQPENIFQGKKSYTVMDIAGILRISRTKAYELVKQKSFPVVSIGRTLRIPAEMFEEWLKKQTSQI